MDGISPNGTELAKQIETAVAVLMRRKSYTNYENEITRFFSNEALKEE